MAKFNNKEGHWYTTENGQHYFVENGQTPQEGWEATKRRKGINNGKYLISEDEGYSFKETDKDTYDKYEAEDAEFDPFEDDDFEIDEDAGWDAIIEKFNYKDENLKPTLEESKEYAYEVYKNVSGKEPDEDTKYSIDRVITESFYKKQLEAEGQGKSMVYTDINKAIVMGDYDEALERLEYQMEDAKKGFSDLKEDEYNELKEKINKAKEDDFDRSQKPVGLDNNPTIDGIRSDLNAASTREEFYAATSKIDEALEAGEINEATADKLYKEADAAIDEKIGNEKPSDITGKESNNNQQFKFGKDNQNRFYVQDTKDGYTHYFASESEAKDYADRMNEAQTLAEDDFEIESVDKIIKDIVTQYENDKNAFGGATPLEALKNTLKFYEEHPEVFKIFSKDKNESQIKNIKAAINKLEKGN